jgi:hypothetical protein
MRFAAASLAFLVGASIAVAQPRPDFSGRWAFVPAKSTGKPSIPRLYNDAGAVAASGPLVITLTAAALQVRIGGVDLVYRLDGSEANISALGRAGFPVGRAAWDGPRLVVTTTQEVFSPAKGDYVKIPSKEVYALQGTVLTVEKTRTSVSGSTQTETLVYTRAGS